MGIKAKNSIFNRLALAIGIIALGILLLVGSSYLSARCDQKDMDCNVTAVIVPHYNRVAQKRSELLNKISKMCHPKTIILLSPNHYRIGESNIAVADKIWQFSRNDAWPDFDLIAHLQNDIDIARNQNIFLNEHGIKNILPTLADYFPKAHFVPIMIKSKTTKQETEDLYQSLQQYCDRCFIVASVDFSHEVSSDLAQKQDMELISALTQLDSDAVWNAVSDSPQSLFVIDQWAHDSNSHFYLYHYNDSSREFNTGNRYLVSYVLGYFLH